MINKDFDSLAKRSIYYFTSTYTPFYPVESDRATAEEQAKAHAFLKGIYDALYENPALLGFKELPDDSFDRWQTQKEKPALPGKIRGVINKTHEFIALIHSIALNGERESDVFVLANDAIAIKRQHIKQLSGFAVKTSAADTHMQFEFPEGMAKGLKLLAELSVANMNAPLRNRANPSLLFSRGVFDITAPFNEAVFGAMLDNSDAYNKLIDFLTANNYTRINNKEINNNISLDFVKYYGAPDDEVKSGWAERTHGGVEFIYEELRKNQLLITLRIPFFGELLENWEKMNEKVLEFVTQTSKKCDNCRYCVSTDKSGKRPLAFKRVGSYAVCPYFCGFQYSWKHLDDELSGKMIEMLIYIDKTFANKTKK